MTTPLVRHRFTANEFVRMATAGILTAEDRVELLEGEIIDMTPIGERHARCVDQLTRLLVLGLRAAATVRVQGPLRLGEHSVVYPDLAVLRAPSTRAADVPPGPTDALLVVEVADTSLDHDREVKIPLYGRYGVPEAWLINLTGPGVEVYRTPSPEGYRDLITLPRTASLAPDAFPFLALSLDEILG